MDGESLLTGSKKHKKRTFFKEFLRENWQDKISQGLFFVRIFAVLGFGALTIANAITGMVLQSANVDCI